MKKVVKEVLSYYIQKEEINEDEKERFFVYRKEHNDTEVYEFEKLSDNNQIGIRCKLNDIDARTVLNLLFYYNIKFSLVEEDYIIGAMEDDGEDEDKIKVTKSLYESLRQGKILKKEWINFFKFPEYEKYKEEDQEDYSEDVKDIIERYGTDIIGMQIYNEKPQIELYYPKLSKRSQKMYTLKEFLGMLK